MGNNGNGNNGQTFMARSTRLLILIENIYTLYGWICLLHNFQRI